MKVFQMHLRLFFKNPLYIGAFLLEEIRLHIAQIVELQKNLNWKNENPLDESDNVPFYLSQTLASDFLFLRDGGTVPTA